MEWSIPHIVDKMAKCVIKGVEEAIIETNSLMHRSDKPAEISKLNLEMFLILKFIDVILVPIASGKFPLLKPNVIFPLYSLVDLEERLQPVRNRLYGKLSSLSGVKVLLLGNASHGYTPDMFKHNFLSAVENMTRIVHFSLHFDCFDELVHRLSENCSQTLRMLDIEHSLMVTDESVQNITKLRNIVELNIFSCGLSTEGQAKVLLGLPQLSNLKRGDFLCDALDWIDWLTDEENIQLGIKEFFSSESYHFHTIDQMMLVAKLCPMIFKMRFMFNKEHFISFLHLKNFKYLNQLHICAGDFYSDNLIDLLEEIGSQLIDLDLYAVDELDMKGIAMISIYCQNLKKLGFSQCGFKRTVDEIYSEGDEYEIFRRQQEARQEQPVEELVQHFTKLESLKLASQCHGDYARYKVWYLLCFN